MIGMEMARKDKEGACRKLRESSFKIIKQNHGIFKLN